MSANCQRCPEQNADDFTNLKRPGRHHLRRLFPQGETNRLRRGHTFLPIELIENAPPLYATSDVDTSDKLLITHYFLASCDWYVVELDPETGDAFGFASVNSGEWGYFNLVEMELTIVHGWMVIERDLDFVRQTMRDLGAY
jgi:hypothetical protein